MKMPIKVKCERKEEEVFAVFDHDSETRIESTGHESLGSYKHGINYKTKLEDIIVFVDTSTACKQFTRIDCYHMRITDFGYLADRNGNQMTYIGGGPVKDSGKGHKCHCDENDLQWRFDEGYVTEKERLPLTGVSLGDTGQTAYEKGAHTIGQLMCKG
eukprot:gene7002-biopygen8428